MNNYIIPYVYYNPDEPSDLDPMVRIVWSDSPEQAREKLKFRLEVEEEDQAKSDGTQPPEVWFSGQRGGNEGWVIGDPMMLPRTKTGYHGV